MYYIGELDGDYVSGPYHNLATARQAAGEKSPTCEVWEGTLAGLSLVRGAA